MAKWGTLALLASASASFGCGGAPTPSIPETASATAITPYLSKSCARARPGVGPTREGDVRQGSSVALGRDSKGLIAYVADHDRARLLVVDVTQKKIEASIPLNGSPEQVMVLGDGRVVVSIGTGRHIEAFEPTGQSNAPLERLCAREVPAGPFALAASPDDRSVVVTSAWEPSLSLFDSDLTPKSATPLSRAPRGVLVDGHNRAFVTHLVGGTLSLVDLDEPTRKPRSISLSVRAGSPIGTEADLIVDRKGTQSYSLASVDIAPPRVALRTSEGNLPMTGVIAPHVPKVVRPTTKHVPPSAPPIVIPPVVTTQPMLPATRIVVPMVSVDPGDASRPGESYYGPPPIAGVPKEAPVAIVVDPIAEKSLTSHVIATTGAQRSGECILPRATAAHPNAELLYVTCLGLDQLLELDARSADPMRTVIRRFPAPAGPTGVALAAHENLAVVYGQFDATLALVPLAGGAITKIDLSAGAIPVNSIALDPSTLRGRELFFRSDNLEVTSDGLACASCHPDGSEDGLTWSTPDGPRQTPMLSGRLPGTAPYGWTRHQDKLETYISDTCQRLGGTGLEPDELRDLTAYITSLPAPPRNNTESPDLVAEGAKVFNEHGCNECHVNGVGTDGKSHQFEGASASEPVDTPSLRDMSLTAPYFHDGRYPTLDALLSDTSSNMGMTSGLKPDERRALRAFLGSL